MKDKIQPETKTDLLHSLEQSHAILEALIESPKNVVIFALDSQYRYLAFNKNHYLTMEKIWNVEIIQGQNMLSYIKKEEDRIKAKANFDHVLLGNAFILEEEYGDVERRYYENNYSPIIKENGAVAGLTLILTDITERKKLEFERNKLINELQDNLKKVKQLSGMLPVCSHCKKIRDDNGYWNQIETYIKKHSEVDFSHGICPECAQKYYSEFINK